MIKYFFPVIIAVVSCGPETGSQDSSPVQSDVAKSSTQTTEEDPIQVLDMDTSDEIVEGESDTMEPVQEEISDDTCHIEECVLERSLVIAPGNPDPSTAKIELWEIQHYEGISSSWDGLMWFTMAKVPGEERIRAVRIDESEHDLKLGFQYQAEVEILTIPEPFADGPGRFVKVLKIFSSVDMRGHPFELNLTEKSLDFSKGPGSILGRKLVCESSILCEEIQFSIEQGYGLRVRFAISPNSDQMVATAIVDIRE